MHVLFVHPNFPAQFRCIAPALADSGWTCSFATSRPDRSLPGVTKVLYKQRWGGTRGNHFTTRCFENATGQAHAVYEALKARPEVQPDLVVAHSGFGSSLFLPYLYDAPIINFLEYYYRPVGQDLGYRPELAVSELMLLRSRTRNASILLDLDNCDRGWCPNHWQRGLFPPQFYGKIEVIPEGVDTRLYSRRNDVNVSLGDGSALRPGTRVVTYVSRGFELMRGFDVFMRAAKLIYQRFPDVIFVVVGEDRVCYGGEDDVIEGRSVLKHVLRNDQYDLSRFCFAGHVPEETLAQVLSISDLHIYRAAAAEFARRHAFDPGELRREMLDRVNALVGPGRRNEKSKSSLADPASCAGRTVVKT